MVDAVGWIRRGVGHNSRRRGPSAIGADVKSVLVVFIVVVIAVTVAAILGHHQQTYEPFHRSALEQGVVKSETTP